jgi:hypothetical protein
MIKRRVKRSRLRDTDENCFPCHALLVSVVDGVCDIRRRTVRAFTGRAFDGAYGRQRDDALEKFRGGRSSLEMG